MKFGISMLVLILVCDVYLLGEAYHVWTNKEEPPQFTIYGEPPRGFVLCWSHKPCEVVELEEWNAYQKWLETPTPVKIKTDEVWI